MIESQLRRLQQSFANKQQQISCRTSGEGPSSGSATSSSLEISGPEVILVREAETSEANLNEEPKMVTNTDEEDLEENPEQIIDN
jgi:hypothetical protein